MRGRAKIAIFASLLALVACGPKPYQRPFGLHGPIEHTLRGDYYTVEKGTSRLPDFTRMHHKATVFAPDLNVVPQSSADGFVGLTDRNEWFAMDYTAALMVETAGTYGFRLVSQDGSRLIIDGRTVVDDDGVHPPVGASGATALTVGRHSVEVQYFKGPHWRAALQLYCTAPGGHEALFPNCGGLSLETPKKWTDSLWWMWLLGILGIAVTWWVLRGRKG